MSEMENRLGDCYEEKVGQKSVEGKPIIYKATFDGENISMGLGWKLD